MQTPTTGSGAVQKYLFNTKHNGLQEVTEVKPEISPRRQANPKGKQAKIKVQ